jgi:type I restriction enzyme S subunit
MSDLSFIEKLLDGVEVEWKPLGGLAENLDSMRKPITSRLRELGSIPYYGASGIVDYVESYIFDGDFLLISEDGANLVARNTPIAFSISGKSWVNNHAHILKFKTYVQRRFVEIFLNSIDLTPYISGAAQPKLNQKNLNSIPIPIPCPDNPKKSLKIQAEIVRILDAFTTYTTELTAELTAELNLRKQQYNYYRDQLLNFEEGDVEWKTLGEVASLITKGTTPKEFVSEGVNFVKLESFENNQIKTNKFMFITPEVHTKDLKRSMLEANDILFAIAGATIGKCAIVDDDILPANTNQALAIVRLGEQVNVNFLFYYLQTAAMKEYISRFNKTSAQPNLNLRQMSEFKIPVPTHAEQSRIVAILDKFDTLTNSITEGLPREIELRKQQYEYYRDLLLSFPKSEDGVSKELKEQA